MLLSEGDDLTIATSDLGSLVPHKPEAFGFFSDKYHTSIAIVKGKIAFAS